MKRRKFTDEQIVLALQHAEQTNVSDTLRRFSVSPATFYRWRMKFGSMTTSEVKKMKLLEEENKKLKQLVADLSLDKKMLQDVLSKKG